MIASLFSPPAQAAVETPRQFGYVIGGRIEHRVSLVLRPGFELDPDSLPERGRIGRWLSLDAVEIDGKARRGASRHTIRLRYQVVNAAQNVIGTGMPPVSLRILGPEGDLPVVVPAWGFPSDRSWPPRNTLRQLAGSAPCPAATARPDHRAHGAGRRVRAARGGGPVNRAQRS